MEGLDGLRGHWWGGRRIAPAKPQVGSMGRVRRLRDLGILSLMAYGAITGPYFAVWEFVTWLKGPILFPIFLYPFPIWVGPIVWYAIMLTGIAAFGLGSLIRRGGD